jgi:uncharacterized SAM-binding protein YcdF (DUF218 family)
MPFPSIAAVPSPHIILVLANLMEADGTLNAETAARVDLASRLFAAVPGAYLSFIGWDYRADSRIAIADAMYDYMRTKCALPADRALINRLSRDSVGDAVISRRDFDRVFGDYRLTVVSSDYHLPRLRHIFCRVYGGLAKIEFMGADIPERQGVAETEASSIAAFDETFRGVASGDAIAFWQRLVTAHPYYNGEKYPKVDAEDTSVELGAI